MLRERLSESLLAEVNKKVNVAKNEKLTTEPKSFYKEIFEERNKNTEKGKICFYYDITHGDKSANKEAIKGSSIYKRLQILAQILLCSSEINKLSEKEKSFCTGLAIYLFLKHKFLRIIPWFPIKLI